MDRREFNVSLLKASAVAILPRFSARAFADEPLSINALYSKAIVIDSLCAPLGDIEATPGADALTAVRKFGITGVNFTISVPDFNETVYNLGNVQKFVDDNPDAFLLVRHHPDLVRAKHENKLGIMLGFQNPEFLEEDPERIATFRKLGVRIMQLTSNKRGKFGDGCLETANAGLTTAAIYTVKLMNDAGVAVDLSHSGYRTTAEGIAHSTRSC